MTGSAHPSRSTLREPTQSGAEETYFALQDKGNKDRSARNYSQAIEAYTRALSRSDNAPLNNRASIYFDRGITFDLANHPSDATRDFREALKMYEDYVRLNPMADDLGSVSFAINNIIAQLSLRDNSDPNDETYLRNVTTRKWPERRFPLRIYIDSSKDNGFDPALQRLIRDAINEWASVPGIYFSWITIPDQRLADIVVSRSSDENEFVDSASQTNFEYKEDDNNTSEVSVVRVKVFCPSDKVNEPANGASAALYTSVLHAFGHAFGVDGHSPNGQDVMYWKSSVGHLSLRDKATLRQLYE